VGAVAGVVGDARLEFFLPLHAEVCVASVLRCLLQRVAVWCRVVQCGTVWYSVVQYVDVCCSVMQCVAVCCWRRTT